MGSASIQILLVKHLLPYFKMFPLDRMSWPENTTRPLEKNLKRWRSLPQSYLSNQEILILCQHWCLEIHGFKNRLNLIEYIEEALFDMPREKRAELHFILALTHLELAISLPRNNQQSHLRLAQVSFEQAKKNSHLQLSSELHHVIVLVARDQLLDAVKLLHQLSKREFIEGQAVAFSVWKTLEKIYTALEKPHWAQFYRHKWMNHRLPINHHFSVLKAA